MRYRKGEGPEKGHLRSEFQALEGGVLRGKIRAKKSAPKNMEFREDHEELCRPPLGVKLGSSATVAREFGLRGTPRFGARSLSG